jgi:hypothetical protein
VGVGNGFGNSGTAKFVGLSGWRLSGGIMVLGGIDVPHSRWSVTSAVKDADAVVEDAHCIVIRFDSVAGIAKAANG